MPLKDNGLKEYRTVSYPVFEMDFKTMFRRFGAQLRGNNLRDEMGVEAYEVYQQIKRNSPNNAGYKPV